MKSSNDSLKAKLVTLPGLKYLYEVDSELKKVTWPTRQQVIRLSVIVIVVSVGIGLYLGALDFAFTSLMSILLDINN